MIVPLIEAPCRVCGWLSLGGARLCLGCQDIHDWAAINRAFCDVLHRQSPLPWYAGDPDMRLTVAVESARRAVWARP